MALHGGKPVLWAGLPPSETLGKCGKVKKLNIYLVRSELYPYIWAINEQQHAMSHLFTPCINEQVVALVTRAFDADGMLVSKGKRNNQKEARAILESGADTSGYVGRYEAHTSILIIAYPSRAI